MKKLLLRLILPLLLLTMVAQAAVPVYVSACGENDNSAKGQVLQSISQETGNTDCSGNGVNGTLHAAVTILSIVVGAAAVIMIILSGFRYITSGGESGKVGSAKNSLIYALVGLVIAALAQLLVHFVLYQSNQATLPTCSQGVKPPNCQD